MYCITRGLSEGCIGSNCGDRTGSAPVGIGFGATGSGECMLETS
jgi:hypothetical protein